MCGVPDKRISAETCRDWHFLSGREPLREVSIGTEKIMYKLSEPLTNTDID